MELLKGNAQIDWCWIGQTDQVDIRPGSGVTVSVDCLKGVNLPVLSMLPQAARREAKNAYPQLAGEIAFLECHDILYGGAAGIGQQGVEVILPYQVEKETTAEASELKQLDSLPLCERHCVHPNKQVANLE